MGNSTTTKMNTFDDNARQFITRADIDSITEYTHYTEEEVFQMLKRFKDLKPTFSTFCISINDLNNLDELKNNPYKNLLLHAIDLYKIIHDYLWVNKNNCNSYVYYEYDIPLAYNVDEYERLGGNENFNFNFPIKNETGFGQLSEARYLKNSSSHSYVLKVEDQNWSVNMRQVIDFKLFCFILNRFSTKRSLDQKFRICFNIFDINKDGYVCYKDLKNYFYQIFGDDNEHFDSHTKDQVIGEYCEKILGEFDQEGRSYKIDYNNFQKILWSSNFITNLAIEP